jgi:NAD(P)-dependent dehydrogenase (short-subunit alcohol dehydrogenase family)
MELSGKVVVVTGGGSGIGAALAAAAAREDAARVVVGDLDAAAAQRVAGDVGGVPVEADVATEQGNAALLEAAGAPVDVFFANAGIGAGEGLGDPEAWGRSWAVNVEAHVHAARLLLPGWLQRGGGWFVSTASAAGLLAQIGSAPYSVTKHAAVAFAEWLAITYGDRGVGVSCLCPMAVETPLLRSDARTENVVRSAGATLQPDEVADTVVQALRDERFLILPHPEVAQFEQFRVGERDKWLAGMRRFQEQTLGAV